MTTEQIACSWNSINHPRSLPIPNNSQTRTFVEFCSTQTTTIRSATVNHQATRRLITQMFERFHLLLSFSLLNQQNASDSSVRSFDGLTHISNVQSSRWVIKFESQIKIFLLRDSLVTDIKWQKRRFFFPRFCSDTSRASLPSLICRRRFIFSRIDSARLAK